jgi:hypothetical protein
MGPGSSYTWQSTRNWTLLCEIRRLFVDLLTRSERTARHIIVARAIFPRYEGKRSRITTPDSAVDWL